MASEDLIGSMQALDLGPSQSSKDLKVDRANAVQSRAPQWKPRPQGGRRGAPANKPTATASKSQSKPEVKEPLSPVAQKAELGSLLTPPPSNKKTKRPRNRKKAPKESSIQTTLSTPAISRQEPTRIDRPPENYPENSLVYIIEAKGSVRNAQKFDEAESIIGVYTSLSVANKEAEQFAKAFGIAPNEIRDITSSFMQGPEPANVQTKATRRIWPNGMSEIRTKFPHGGPLDWIKVLPKDFEGPTESGAKHSGATTVFLALDQCVGLFAIAAYASKQQAWEGCRKYWTQLSYCTPIEKKEQWVDKLGMYHAKGAVGGRMHHWFVEPYIVDNIGDDGTGA